MRACTGRRCTRIHQCAGGKRAGGDRIAAAAVQGVPEHEHVPAAYPQRVVLGQVAPQQCSVAEVAAQVDLAGPETQPGHRRQLTVNGFAADVFRREIHRVSDNGNAGSLTGERGQKLGVAPKPER